MSDSHARATQTGRQPFLNALMVVFGGTLAVQAVAFLRQLVIASAFGVDRSMDIYVLVFTVASIVGFGLGAVMENATVPLLVQEKTSGDRDGFRQIALRVLILAGGLGLAASLVLLAAVPIAARVVTTGLSPTERSAMADLAWWFTPWVAVSIPYFAVGSLLKADSRFRRFMIAEVTVTVVSLGILLIWRPGVHAIPLAYAGGYAVALLTMLPGLPVARKLNDRASGRSWGVLRQIGRFGAVAQVGTLGALSDRFLASHLPVGAIAAGSYSGLITGQVGALLSFRDAYMVPLSEPDGRAEKLERMMGGLLLLSVPCAIFLSARADLVVGVLLGRGRFDGAAVALAAEMLSLQALALPASALVLPIYRTLQIIGRMRFASYLLLVAAATNLAVGSLLMFGFEMGLRGYLFASLAAAHATFILAFAQMRMAGVALNLTKPLAFALYAGSASLVGLWVGSRIAPDVPMAVRLATDAAAFACVLALASAAIRGPLKRLIGREGASSSGGAAALQGVGGAGPPPTT